MTTRREFITLSGSAAAWPLAAQAQPAADRMRRIAMLFPFAEADREAGGRVTALRDGLKAAGWSEGGNLQIEYRWSAASDRVRRYVSEIMAFGPDVIVTGSTPVAQFLRSAAASIPTVFVGVADPVGSGLIPSLARPAGNLTGFTAFEPAIVTKWLSLLKEIAPTLQSVALLFNIETAPSAEQFWRAFATAAPTFAVEPIRMQVRDAPEIERAMEGLANSRNGGLLSVPEFTVTRYRELIVGLTARHRLPAVSPYRYFPAPGGLASYGIDVNDMWRRAASYVNRILKGAKPADLPVQAPTKFELVLNRKTATALGLTFPHTLLVTADEVIE